MLINKPKLEVGKSYTKRVTGSESSIRTIVNQFELWDGSYAFTDELGQDYENDGMSFSLNEDDDLVMEVMV